MTAMPELNTVKGDDIQTVLTRLSETIQWCSQLEPDDNPETALRSPAIYPYPFFADGPKAIVRSVADRRHWRLQLKTSTPATSLANGRWLYYFPDANATDGFSGKMSKGFFDIDDTPPWDTWVAYVHESQHIQYVVSWIPPAYIELASIGIRVNALEWSGWLDEIFQWRQGEDGSLLKKFLREYGL